MSGGLFARHSCGRLLIAGQACVCEPPKPRPCDCTYDGNRQVIGPDCRRKIHEAWAAAMRAAR